MGVCCGGRGVDGGLVGVQERHQCEQGLVDEAVWEGGGRGGEEVRWFLRGVGRVVCRETWGFL
jgi:hypothetical protein